MNNVDLVIKDLCESPYLDQYIIKLKDNEVLFSVDKNLLPAKEVESGAYTSSFWKGLELIETYCRQEKNNKKTNEFIVSLMDEVIKKITSQKENDYHKRYSSSFTIMSTLSSIIFSKTLFINELDIVGFINEYLDSPLTYDYSLISDISKNINEIVNADKNRILSIYKTIINHKDIGSECYTYLVDEKIEPLIDINPIEFYESSIKILSKADDIYSMGSFEKYISISNYEFNKVDVSINWFKIAIKKMDWDYLKSFVDKYLLSRNKLLSKASLYIVSHSFGSSNGYFYERINTILSKEYLYLDTKYLLKNNLEAIKDGNKIEFVISCISKANFGSKKKEPKQLLRNYLLSIVNKNVTYYFNKKEEEYVSNYGKAFYFVDISKEDEIRELYSKIEGLKFEGILKQYDVIENRSFYFDDVVTSCLYKYIDEKNIDIKVYKDLISSRLLSSLIYESDSKKNYKQTGILIGLLIDKNDITNKELQSVLYSYRRLMESANSEYVIKSIKSFPYNKISFETYSSDSYITYFINQTPYEYLDILIKCNNIDNSLVDVIFKSINYFKEREQKWAVKAMMAGYVSDLYKINEEYVLKNLDYIFSNEYNKNNPSYYMFCDANSIDSKLLGNIINRIDFEEFFYEKSSDTDHSYCKSYLFSLLINDYLYTGNNYRLIQKLVNDNYKLLVIEGLEFLNVCFNNPDIDINKVYKMTNLFFKKDAINKLGNEYNFERLAISVSKLIIESKNTIKNAWGLLIEVVNNIKYYFPDEIFELVNLYKTTEISNIIHILDKYFNKYGKLYIDDNKIIKMINLVKDCNKYEDKILEWKSYVVNINPEINI